MKFLQLKEWLTVEDAASYLSEIFEEEIATSDVLRLGLDGHLTISARFVNGVLGREAEFVDLENAKFFVFPKNVRKAQILPLSNFPGFKKVTFSYRRDEFVFSIEHPDLECGFPIGTPLPEGRFIECFGSVNRVYEVFDLLLIGGDRLFLESVCNSSDGGVSVDSRSVSMDSTLVKCPIENKIIKLYKVLKKKPEGDSTDEDNGPGASDERRRYSVIAAMQVMLSKLSTLDNCKGSKELRKLEEEHGLLPLSGTFVPATELPDDMQLVVRVPVLQKFLQACRADVSNSVESSGDEGNAPSEQLALALAAHRKFWMRADRQESDTQRKQKEIVSWMRRQKPDIAITAIENIAKIIRPDWARSGRKPER